MKSKTKKLFLTLFAFTSLSLAACGGGNESSSAPSGGDSSSQSGSESSSEGSSEGSSSEPEADTHVVTAEKFAEVVNDYECFGGSATFDCELVSGTDEMDLKLEIQGLKFKQTESFGSEEGVLYVQLKENATTGKYDLERYTYNQEQDKWYFSTNEFKGFTYYYMSYGIAFDKLDFEDFTYNPTTHKYVLDEEVTLDYSTEYGKEYYKITYKTLSFMFENNKIVSVEGTYLYRSSTVISISVTASKYGATTVTLPNAEPEPTPGPKLPDNFIYVVKNGMDDIVEVLQNDPDDETQFKLKDFILEAGDIVSFKIKDYEEWLHFDKLQGVQGKDNFFESSTVSKQEGNIQVKAGQTGVYSFYVKKDNSAVHFYREDYVPEPVNYLYLIRDGEPDLKVALEDDPDDNTQYRLQDITLEIGDIISFKLDGHEDWLKYANLNGIGKATYFKSSEVEHQEGNIEVKAPWGNMGYSFYVKKDASGVWFVNENADHNYYVTGSFNSWVTTDPSYVLARGTKTATEEGNGVDETKDGHPQYFINNVVLTAEAELKITREGEYWPASNVPIAETGTYNIYFVTGGTVSEWDNQCYKVVKQVEPPVANTYKFSFNGGEYFDLEKGSDNGNYEQYVVGNIEFGVGETIAFKKNSDGLVPELDSTTTFTKTGDVISCNTADTYNIYLKINKTDASDVKLYIGPSVPTTYRLVGLVDWTYDKGMPLTNDDIHKMDSDQNQWVIRNVELTAGQSIKLFDGTSWVGYSSTDLGTNPNFKEGTTTNIDVLYTGSYDIYLKYDGSANHIYIYKHVPTSGVKYTFTQNWIWGDNVVVAAKVVGGTYDGQWVKAEAYDQFSIYIDIGAATSATFKRLPNDADPANYDSVGWNESAADLVNHTISWA